jgi:hypothetical protein
MRLKRKRNEKITTFSVSVSEDTKARLRKVAARSYGGSVSALIEAIAREAERQDAIDSLLRLAPPIDEDAYMEFVKELDGVRNKRKRRAA